MKRTLLTLFLCLSIILVGCSTVGDIGTENISASATNGVQTEVKKYPEDTGIDFMQYAYIAPEEIYSSTAEENGLSGEVYMILGRVEEYFFSDTGSGYLRIDTVEGEVVIADAVETFRSSDELKDLGEIDFEKMRSYCPIPEEDEFCVIFAEYQGMSSTFNCPFFTYASSDYLTEALLLSIVNSPTHEETETTQPTAPAETTEPPEKGSKENPYRSGMYKVGTDLPAGEYLFFSNASQRAYVCASSDSNQDDILENNNFSNSFFMTVADGQYLEASRCYFINASDYTVPINEDGSFDEGMYRVGIDIPAGEYKLTAEEDRAYWCLYNNSVVPFDIEDNDLFEGNTYVTVREGQYLIIKRCTAKPV